MVFLSSSDLFTLNMWKLVKEKCLSLFIILRWKYKLFSVVVQKMLTITSSERFKHMANTIKFPQVIVKVPCNAPFVILQWSWIEWTLDVFCYSAFHYTDHCKFVSWSALGAILFKFTLDTVVNFVTQPTKILSSYIAEYL